jgi:hypothetical protein
MSAAALSSVELLAVTKAVQAKIAKDARTGVEPGEYNLSFNAHIEGVIRVGQDYEQPMPNKAKPWNIIAVLLEELNTMRAASGEAGVNLDKIIKMAEAVDPDLVKNAKDQAAKEASALKQATMTTCKGKVTSSLEVTPLAQG